MHKPVILAATLSMLLVTQTGCGTSTSAVGALPPSSSAPIDVPTTSSPPVEPTEPTAPPATAPATTAPPTTAPPTIAPPTTAPDAPQPTTVAPAAPTPTTVPRSPRPAATVEVEIDDGTFGSVSEMADAATLIVVGEVIDVTSLGRPFAAGAPNADEFVAITVRIGETLKGEPTDEIVLTWQAFATDADGRRTGTLVTNGLRPPDVADRLVLFLGTVDPAWSAVVGGVPTHQLVKLDGIAFLDGDQPISGEVGSLAAQQLSAMSLAEIRNAIAA